MLAPPVIVIQGTALVAVHAQNPPVITEMLPLWPVDSADLLVGDTLYVHCASAARTSSPHHEAKSSANVTPARRSVMHIPFFNRRNTSPLMNDAQNCIQRAVGPWPQVMVCQ